MPDLASRLNAALAGRYALQREIGTGGMATVFLADDLRTPRRVAFKVLHPELAAVLGPERFLREIEIAARLNHPHILLLLESGSAEGLLYYVMPYAEGGSLRQRIASERQLPVADALRIIREVTDALDYAHRRGVVHRDIKPENILFQDGHALIADFGIARAMAAAGGEALTTTGVVLGTPAYMSPEQAAGERQIDGRSDLYSVGCVLYEMLAGQAPFTGATSESLAYQHRSVAPRPVTDLRPTVSADLSRTIQRLLAKAPADRFSSAAEFGAAIPIGAVGGAGERHEAIPAPVETETTPRPVRAPALSRRPGWPLLAGGAVVVAVVAALLTPRLFQPRHPGTPASGGGPVRFTIELPEGLVVPTGPRRKIAISPDGSMLVFGGHDGHKDQLYLRTMGEAEARPIAGSEGADAPFFSPDGEWIGFFAADRSLKKERVSGGEPVVLGRGFRDIYAGACWGSDGTIVVGTAVSPLRRIPEAGGEAEVIVERDPGEGLNMLDPEILPGGRTVLYTVGKGDMGRRIDAVDLKSGRRQTVIDDGSKPKYVDAGYLVFSRGDTLMAVPFDEKHLRLEGSPVPVLSGVAVAYFGSVPHLALSRSGTLAYIFAADATPRRSLLRVNRSGVASPFPVDERGYLWCALTRDGSWLAVGTWELEDTGVWVTPLDRFALTRLPLDGYLGTPIWNPDGRHIVLAHSPRAQGRDAGTGWEIFSVPIEERARPERLTDNVFAESPTSWTRDGRYLVIQDWSSGKGIGYLRWREVGGPPDTAVFVAEGAGGAVSPDGKWLAFSSGQSGRGEIFVQRFPAGGGRRQVSTRGGLFPAWSPRGDELFYVRGYPGWGRSSAEPSETPGQAQPEFIAVKVRNLPDIAFGKEQVLFAGEYAYGKAGMRCYDVGPDAQWFVVASADHSTGPTRVQVVANWVDQIRERFAARESTP